MPNRHAWDDVVQKLTGLSCASTISSRHLIIEALPTNDHTKDIDFAGARLDARWQAGVPGARRALHHKSWLAPMPTPVGMVIHEHPGRRVRCND